MKFYFLASLLILSLNVFAGPNSSGGAMVVTCLSASGNFKSVELLDVYEAKLREGNDVLKPTGDLLEDYTRITNNSLALQGTAPIPAKFHRERLTQMLSLIDWKSDLLFLGDQGNSVDLPENCRLEQLAIFFDSRERMSVNKSLWKKIDSISKAAFFVHESYYYRERKFTEETSEVTRSFVGQVISRGGTPVKHGSEGASEYCLAVDRKGNATSFFIHREVNEIELENVTFQFLSIAGRRMLVKSIANFENIIFETKISGDDLVPQAQSANKKMIVPIETDLRKDWEAKLIFLGGTPVEVRILQKGITISKLKLSAHSCRANN